MKKYLLSGKFVLERHNSRNVIIFEIIAIQHSINITTNVTIVIIQSYTQRFKVNEARTNSWHFF